MCIACLEYIKGTLTKWEAVRALREIKSTDDPGNVIHLTELTDELRREDNITKGKNKE